MALLIEGLLARLLVRNLNELHNYSSPTNRRYEVRYEVANRRSNSHINPKLISLELCVNVCFNTSVMK